MKQRIKSKINKKYLFSLTGLLIFSTLIWFYGPGLNYHHQFPLMMPEKRIYIIIIVFLIWILKYLLLDMKPEDNKKTTSLPIEIQKKVARLQGRFQGAIEFLKKTSINKQGKDVNLSHLPWYVFIGPEGAGKTTLLANSNIHFILSKQFNDPINAITSSDTCDWWVTRDLVLIDVPGLFLQSKPTVLAEKNQLFHLWHYFLKLIKQFHCHQAIQGIIIALNLPELIKEEREEKNKLIHEIKKRIIDVFDRLGKTIPVHLVITKCDLLPGFREFFSDCTSDEISQAWGITTFPLNKNENVIDLFNHRFNALIKRINKQLITRLHQERNPFARPYIKDFPLHMERLKESITQSIKALIFPQLQLQSVYLTSGIQENHEESKTYFSEMNHTQALQIMSNPAMPTRAYFVKQWLLHHLPSMPMLQAKPLKKTNRWEQRLLYTMSIATIIGASIVLGRDFQQGIQRAYSIQNDLTNYQLSIRDVSQQSDRLIHALPLLNALQQAAHPANDKLLLTFYSNKSVTTAATVYQQALQTIVLPEIKNYFEKDLATAMHNNPEKVYAILKAYLMLNDKAHFQADYVAKILQQYMTHNVDQKDIQELTTHIHAALAAAHLDVKLNVDLISDVRNQLTHLSNEALGFILLKNRDNNNVDSFISLGTDSGNPPVFTSKAIAMQIPSLFTGKAFQKIINEEIPIVAVEVIQGNWVLGMNPVLSNDGMIKILADAIRTRYITNYIDIWESLLDNLALNTPKNLLQVSTMLTTMTSDHSPLIQVLDTIKQNTAFSLITDNSPKLQTLSTLLVNADNDKRSPLYPIFVSLKQLDIYLKTILSSPPIEKSLREATAKRMQVSKEDPITQIDFIANQSPEPMKTWLHTIASQTWGFMLLETRKAIETAWEKDIITTYHMDITPHYPFNQKADTEVSLDQFTRFLGGQGKLAKFYQNYLKPFVNEEKKWEWRSVDNQTLGFKDHALALLQQANRVQHAFFPNDDNQLYVQFALQPINLDTKMKGFNLNINGQEIRYQKNKENPERLIAWPGSNAMHATTINFVAPDNQLLISREEGEWGWFRLVTHSTTTIKSRKELLLSFNVDGHIANYHLLTQGHLNPFLPLNLERFELPEKLG